MKFFLVLCAVAPAVVANAMLDKRAACNADNCARAVTGTRQGDQVPASRVSTDCASFQKATAYPSAVTVTTSSGSTTTTLQPSFQSTTVSPTFLPSYVYVACSSGGNPASRFASACSCAGQTASTTTAAAPTVTVVVPIARGYPCGDTGVAGGSGNFGSCTGDCFCDRRLADGSTGGFCDKSESCTTPCASDNDCPSNSACAIGGFFINCAGGSSCVPLDGCNPPPAARRLLKKDVNTTSRFNPDGSINYPTSS